jgi:ElaB/YqjD/DUF883 family membrane-anchored ribosome-binding protein
LPGSGRKKIRWIVYIKSCFFERDGDVCFTMQNETSFPTTRQDIANLKRTAADAAADLSSTASVHAGKAGAQLGELASHAREEGAARLSQVQDSFGEVLESARAYAIARPIATIGIAVGVGLVLGMLFHRNRRVRTE